MKRTLLVLACVSFLAVSATSCKKDCVCKATVGGVSSEYSAGKMSKKDCEAYKYSLAGVEFKCEAQ